MLLAICRAFPPGPVRRVAGLWHDECGRIRPHPVVRLARYRRLAFSGKVIKTKCGLGAVASGQPANFPTRRALQGQALFRGRGPISLLDLYAGKVTARHIERDASQEDVLRRLEELRVTLEGDPTRNPGVLGWLTGSHRKGTPVHGLYIWGDAGRGKTMLRPPPGANPACIFMVSWLVSTPSSMLGANNGAMVRPRATTLSRRWRMPSPKNPRFCVSTSSASPTSPTR